MIEQTSRGEFGGSGRSQEMRQIGARCELAELLLDVDVDVEWRAVMHRCRSGLHPGGRVRLHVRRVDGRRRAHAERRIGRRRVRKRGSGAVDGRTHGVDGRRRVIGLVHGRREWLRGPRVLRVNDGADGVVR